MTTTFESEHQWFSDQIATYLAGGLREPSELQRFQAHAAACPACADELSESRKMEAQMSQVFSMTMPDADFEQRLASRLQFRLSRRYRVHPMVRKAAIAAAVALLLGGVGYVQQSVLKDGKLPSLSLPDMNPSRLVPMLTDRKLQRNVTAEEAAKGIEHGAEQYALTDARKTVSDLVNQARGLTEAHQYPQALAALDQILVLDPKNDYALGARPLVEDRASIIQQREYRDIYQREAVKSNAAEEAKVPYFDILRYPTEWPDLSAQRDRTASSAGNGTLQAQSGKLPSLNSLDVNGAATDPRGLVADSGTASGSTATKLDSFLGRIAGTSGGLTIIPKDAAVNSPEAIFWAGGQVLDADGTTVLAAGGTVNRRVVSGGTFRLGTPGGNTANAGSITTASTGLLLTANSGGTIDVSNVYDADGDGIIDYQAFATAKGTTWAGNGGNVSGNNRGITAQQTVGTGRLNSGTAGSAQPQITASNGTAVFSGGLANGNLTKAGPSYQYLPQAGERAVSTVSGTTDTRDQKDESSHRKLLAATDAASVVAGPIPGAGAGNKQFTFTAGGTSWSNPNAWLFGNPPASDARSGTVVVSGPADQLNEVMETIKQVDGKLNLGTGVRSLQINGISNIPTQETTVNSITNGSGTLVKGGTGQVALNQGTFSGAARASGSALTSGAATVSGGTLRMVNQGSIAGSGSIGSLDFNGAATNVQPLVIDSPTGTMAFNSASSNFSSLTIQTGNVRLNNQNQQPAAGTLTVQNSGSFNTNGFSKIGGDGKMIVDQMALNGPLAVSGGTLQVKSGAGTSDLIAVNGNPDLKTKTGAGTLTVDAGRNTFGNNGTAGLNVTQGTVRMEHHEAAPQSGTVTFNTAANPNSLDIGGGTAALNVTAGNHSIQVPAQFSAGALTTGATGGPGTVIINSAPITVNRINFEPTGTQSNSYTVNQSGSLASLATVNGGTLDAVGRTVTMDGPFNIGTASFKPASSGSFDLNGSQQSVGQLAGNVGAGTAAAPRTPAAGNGTVTFSGTGPNPTGSSTIEERMQLRRGADSAPSPVPAQRPNLTNSGGSDVRFQDVPADRANQTAPQSGGALITADALAQAATQPGRTAPGGGAITTQQQQNTANAAAARRVIREGTMEFEVDSFDSTFNQIATIVGEEGGFIAAADSDKLPNGKVRGQITVRVPPDRLDLLVLKLRALGELKSQKLGSRDIGKDYTDLESAMRADRAMEQRLIDIIAKAPGKVDELLQAEKELGITRARIEKTIGMLNYYNNLISLATLTINAYEKDIRTPASANIVEEINTGVETEDVETARTEALKAIDAAKGRIVESTLQKLEAGQFAAKIVAEVSTENAGPIVDRLKQLGRLARYDVQKKQVIENARPGTAGQAQQQAPVRLETIPTRIIISMYNLANVAPRLTTNLNLAGDDVETVYRAILKRIADAGGRVVSSNLNRQDAAQVSGTIQFEIKTPDADAVLNDVRQQALVLRMTVTENPDTANVTTAKQAFTAQIIPTAQLSSKLMTNLNLAAQDVEATYNNVLKRINASAGARVITSNLNRQDAARISGTVQFEIKAGDADAVLNDIRAQGLVLRMNVTENADGVNVTTTKRGFTATINPIAQLSPKFTTNLSLAAADVEKTYGEILGTIRDSAGSRVVTSNLNRQDAMQAVGAIQFEVSSADAAAVLTKIRQNVQTLQLNVAENPSSENVTTEKQAFIVQVIPTSQVQPRETRVLGIQTGNVEGAVQVVNAAVGGAGGRIVESSMSQDRGGNSVARMVVEVPLDKVEAVADSIRKQGTVRASESNKNTQIPEGPLSRARLNLTIATGETIVPAEGGFGNSVREGLSTSVKGLLWSLQLIVIGLCLIGPWVLMVWGGWRFARKRKAAKPQ